MTGATLNNVGIDKDGGANPVELTTATDANISPTGFGVGFDIGDGGSGWGRLQLGDFPDQHGPDLTLADLVGEQNRRAR